MDFLKRINWLMVLAYFILMGAVTPLIIYLTNDLFDLSPGLALSLMFGMLGSIAYAFFLMGEGRGWKWLAYAEGMMSGFCLWLWLMVDDYIPTAVGLSSLMFILAGMVMFIAYRRRVGQQHQIEGGGFRELGSGERLGDLSPMERDHAPANRDRGDHGAR